ncbi:MAG: alpha-L-fucosidase [Anaerolineae bacterium]
MKISFSRGLLLTALIFALATLALSAQETVYEPTYESLSQHQIPDWYDDAKLGIFIHWGAYSVPGWAPLTGELDEVLAENATADGQPGWAYWFAHNPYAEWYSNSMRVEDSDTQNYHIETYGADFAYEDFVPLFNEATQNWNPDEWAELFADVGARYVVLTTKHHDGFLLWPSENPNPFLEDFQSERDLVGELTDAVRDNGMRMGLYYSGGLDWTFEDLTITDFNTLIAAIPQSQEYADYANTHWRELIERYQPSILWNDLGYPQIGEPYQLFAEYYNAIPEGVINNRFGLGLPRDQFHYDFETPEYAELADIQEQKWESTRGLGYSFGYNMNDSDENLLTVDELVDSFVDIVSKNGNLLLNIGPMADGTIPDVQRSRLEGLGAWLDVNGEAIFDTRPWERAESLANGEVEVRFTQKDDVLYAVLLSTPAGTDITIEDVTPAEGAVITLLGGEGELEWTQEGDNIVITLPEALAEDHAHTFRIAAGM